MTYAPRSFYRIIIALLSFLLVLAWSWSQIKYGSPQPVEQRHWLNAQSWLQPIANHQPLGAAAFNVDNLNDVYFVDKQHGWAVEAYGVILYTDNGGKNWQPQTSTVETGLKSIHVDSDAQHGWAVGDDGVILYTDNGGKNWQRQTSSVKSWLNRYTLTVTHNTAGQWVMMV